MKDGIRFFVTANGSVISQGHGGRIAYKYIEHILPVNESLPCLTKEEARRPTEIDGNHWSAAVSIIGENENEAVSSEESDTRKHFGIL